MHKAKQTMASLYKNKHEVPLPKLKRGVVFMTGYRTLLGAFLGALLGSSQLPLYYAHADEETPTANTTNVVTETNTSNTSNTSNTTYIPVGNARTKKTVLAFPEVHSKNSFERSLGDTVFRTVSSDLNFMDLFTFLNSSSFVENQKRAGITQGTFKFSDWTKIGAEFVLKTSVELDANKNLSLEAHIFDPFNSKEVLAKKYTAPASEIKTIAHTFANDVVKTLTGMPGIFLTKIAMTCDMNGKKEIYTTNFDGTDVKQVTHHRSLAFAPAWSPNGTRIAYSLYTRHNNIKNIDLYEFNFTTNTIRLISGKKGINSGAAYSPDGTKMAATLSYLGNPEIFLIDLTTGATERITKSFGFDVDPSWSPDGKQISFVSSRTGMPMVFKMDADGKNIQRLTYAGRYNATPSWSLQNNKIAFAGWIDKSFDIFIMNPDGTHIERLTKNQRSNEDPFFSPDGNFVAFSSNRTGQKNIYVMNVDGTFVKRLTYGLGNCVSPKWSNPPIAKVSNTQN